MSVSEAFCLHVYLLSLLSARLPSEPSVGTSISGVFCPLPIEAFTDNWKSYGGCQDFLWGKGGGQLRDNFLTNLLLSPV
jgi:hypothetical protein